jgi:pimeloyl-ACP methyl ester carboxylesterase
LVLVHGVDSFGEWYPIVKTVLSVHFECTPYEYSDYRFAGRHLGKLKVAIGPRWMILSGIIFSVILWNWHTWIGLASAAVLSVAAVWLAGWLRSRSDMFWRLEHGLKGPATRRWHVIAHSFGTYVVGNSAQRFPLRIRHIVFAGSVLPRSFDWSRLFKVGPGNLDGVSNFVVKADLVVKLAGFVGFISRDLGASGTQGFHMAHTLANPNELCAPCAGQDLRFVHNVVTAARAHSDLVNSPSSIEQYFLPCFWNVPIGELERWWHNCEALAEALDEFYPFEPLRLGDLEGGSCATVARFVREVRWQSLTIGGRAQSLYEYVVVEVDAQTEGQLNDDEVDEAIGFAICESCALVRAAIHAEYDAIEKTGLRPRYSVHEAVSNVLEVLFEEQSE